MKAIRTIAQVALIAGAFGVGSIVVAPAANAASYSATNAANYAVKYSCNENSSCRNGTYEANTDDCADFVSQALDAGGLSHDSTWDYVYLQDGLGKKSDAWGKAPDLFNWLTAHHGSAHSLDAYFGGNGTTPAKTGAVIEYDWGGGEGWSHVAMVTGTGTYANYVDSGTGKNYRIITPSDNGTRITQHTTDRDGAPWNMGYWVYKSSWRVNAHARYVQVS